MRGDDGFYAGPAPICPGFAQMRADAHVCVMVQTIMLIEGADAGLWSFAPDDATLIMVPYACLTLATLKDHLPDQVILPLFGADFDAMDALARLAQFGFSGPVTVIGPALPNPGVINRELSASAPGMAVQLLVAGQAGLSR
jgi:hypothetical protein